MAIRQRRLSYDALWRAAGRPSQQEMAMRTGVARRQWQRWSHESGIPESSADRVAVRLGLHPALVWADWYETADDEFRLSIAGVEG